MFRTLINAEIPAFCKVNQILQYNFYSKDDTIRITRSSIVLLDRCTWYNGKFDKSLNFKGNLNILQDYVRLLFVNTRNEYSWYFFYQVVKPTQITWKLHLTSLFFFRNVTQLNFRVFSFSITGKTRPTYKVCGAHAYTNSMRLSACHVPVIFDGSCGFRQQEKRYFQVLYDQRCGGNRKARCKINLPEGSTRSSTFSSREASSVHPQLPNLKSESPNYNIVVSSIKTVSERLNRTTSI